MARPPFLLNARKINFWCDGHLLLGLRDEASARGITVAEALRLAADKWIVWSRRDRKETKRGGQNPSPSATPESR